MSAHPAEDPRSEASPGVVEFTAAGEAALDDLAASLAADCDGSAESITEILDRVLDSSIEELAAQLRPSGQSASAAGLEVGPPAESPDQAARRRMGTHRASGPSTEPPGPAIAR